LRNRIGSKWLKNCKQKKKGDTRKLTEWPHIKKTIDVNCGFEVKFKPNWRCIRLCKKGGFMQKFMLDYVEVQIATLETVRFIVVLGHNRNWPLHHLDLKLFFLNLNGLLKCPFRCEIAPSLGLVIEGKQIIVYTLWSFLWT